MQPWVANSNAIVESTPRTACTLCLASHGLTVFLMVTMFLTVPQAVIDFGDDEALSESVALRVHARVASLAASLKKHVERGE